jgi:hypothetical protein
MQHALSSTNVALLSDAQKHIDSLASEVHECMRLLDSDDIYEPTERAIDLDRGAILDDPVFFRVYHPRKRARLIDPDLYTEYRTAVTHLSRTLETQLPLWYAHTCRYIAAITTIGNHHVATLRATMRTLLQRTAHYIRNEYAIRTTRARTIANTTAEEASAYRSTPYATHTVIMQQQLATPIVMRHTVVWRRALSLVVTQLLRQD